MDSTLTRGKKAGFLAAAMGLSLLWLGYQVLLWNSGKQYYMFTREIIESLGISAMNTDSEWQRFTSVLGYTQTLPHVLLAYCLFVKWPGKGRKWPRVLLVAAVWLLSLVTIPRLARVLFPSYKNLFSPNHPDYHMVLLYHGVLALAGAAAVALVTVISALLRRSRELFRPRAMARAAGRYGLTILIALMTGVAYGFVLGILNNFNSNAVDWVVSAFSPDSRLISGILTMCVMAPLTEELAFRGMILSKTRKFSSAWIGVIFSSILFGLWHRNLGQFFATSIMGFVFSWVYLQTGKLRYAMVCHSASNLFLALALSNGTGYLPKIELLTDARYAVLDVSLVGGLAGVAVTAGAMVLLIWKVYPLVAEK